MASEYKLSYTASEIDARLGKVNELETSVANLSEDLDMDMLSMLHESGIINLIEDSNGKLYVDETEKLYII